MATNDPTSVAQTLYFEGRAAEAEDLFRKVLGEQPDDVVAIEGLGVLVLQQGRPARPRGCSPAASSCSRIRPGCTPTWARRCGRSGGSTRRSSA